MTTEHTVPKTATFIRDLDKSLATWVAKASLYKLDPPISFWGDDAGDTSAYVRVSAADVPFSGPETYIFPSDENGEVCSWAELDGSYRGGFDHDAALNGAGYEVVR